MSQSYHHSRHRWSVRAGEAVLSALAWCFRWATWPVPTWTLTGLVAPVGGAVALAVPGFRRRAERNLAFVWPDMPGPERRRIVRAAASQFSRLMVEYARLDKALPAFEIEVEGAEHLLAARAAGRGAILVSAHFGNWEAARMAALRLGCETGILTRPFNNRYLDRFTRGLIPCAGRPIIRKGWPGMRQLLDHLAVGGFVMILVDQRNSGAPFLDFLGRPAETATGAADMALRTGAALIPVRAARNVAARRFDVCFEAPVTGDDGRAMMAEVNRRIGAWITAAPDQWLWFHRRWRTTVLSRRHGRKGG